MTVALAVLSALLLFIGSVCVFRLLALMEGLSLWGIVKCFFRSYCLPVKHALGGFQCASCSMSGSDMGQFPGHEGAGFVPPIRRVFDRRNGGEWTRTVAWERERGKW